MVVLYAESQSFTQKKKSMKDNIGCMIEIDVEWKIQREIVKEKLREKTTKKKRPNWNAGSVALQNFS